MKNLPSEMKKLFVLTTITILCTSCPGFKLPDDDYEFEYETIVTEEAVNLEGINSTYDDYNSSLPYSGLSHRFYYSCNHPSRGDHFDIVFKNLNITYHDRDDVLNVGYGSSEVSKFNQKLLPAINSEYDELGPLYYFGPDQNSYFLYANNENGDYDIKAVMWNKSSFGSYQATEEISEPYFLRKFNSDADDLYPTFTADDNEMYFCSNRDVENFNIYKLNVTEDMIQTDSSGDNGQVKATIVQELSSAANDKCPSIYKNIMIFASDRTGGYGGFDLYISEYINGHWSAPVNMGEKVNSEFDEYRPIIIQSYQFDGRMIIFSSNRPTGKGGFDLYAARNYELPDEAYPN
jgi:hypothetical protein